MINLVEKEYCNYQSQFKGLGIKIALMEYYPSNWFYKKNIGNPLNANWKDVRGDNEEENHPYKTGCIIRDMLPLAQIDYIPQNNEGVAYIKANNYHIVSFSAMDCRADDALEKELSNSVLLLCGAGNDGSIGESPTAMNEWWTSIGAVHSISSQSTSDKLEFAWYSSYSKSAVDYVSFSNIKYDEYSDCVIGTSFSCPFMVGLICQFYEAYKLKFSFYPTVKEVLDFMKENSVPALHDRLKEGNGIVILPDFNTYNFGTVIKLNSNEINVNGIIKNTVNPAQIINNKTMVELTVLRECRGNKVYWNDKTKCAIVK